MKNYYAILEVPVGCSVAEIRQGYRRLVQESGDNEGALADLQEAHEVLTTPARRADYDRAVWGETFTPDEGEAADGATLLPGAALLPGAGLPSVLDPTVPRDGAGGPGRCPMGAEAQCPVLLGGAGPADAYCPDCGYLLAGLGSAPAFAPPDEGEAVRLDEPGGRSHRLRPGQNTVGREGADVMLPDKTVSRRHARLEVGDDGVVTLEDLSSTNGTQVGADVLVPHVPRTLQAGDRLRFGSVTAVLHLPGAVENPAPGPNSEFAPPAPNAGGAGEAGAESPPGSFPAPPELGPGEARAQVVETREEGGRTFPLVSGVTTFGRRAENTVVLPGDPYVSGSHAQIIADGDVFRLTDVGSTNGTLLNGRRLAINEPEALTPGDVILIGGTALRFEQIEVPVEVPEEAVPEEEGPEEGRDSPAEAVPAETVSAEPRERMAPEYDVPDDEADNGLPTRAAPAHESGAHESP